MSLVDKIEYCAAKNNIYLKSKCVNRLAIAMATANVFVLLVCYIQYIYCIGINLSH